MESEIRASPWLASSSGLGVPYPLPAAVFMPCGRPLDGPDMSRVAGCFQSRWQSDDTCYCERFALAFMA